MIEPVRKPVRQVQREVTRDRIVEAAQSCFTERGVAATAFDEIALRAGVSRATLYLHFANKNAVLLHLLTMRLGEVRRLYARLVSLEGLDEEAVLMWLTRYADSVRRHRDVLPLFGVGLSGEAGLTDIVDTHRRNAIALLGERFPAFDVRAGFAADRAMRSARALLMILQIDQAAGLVAMTEEADAEGQAVLVIVARALSAMLVEMD